MKKWLVLSPGFLFASMVVFGTDVQAGKKSNRCDCAVTVPWTQPAPCPPSAPAPAAATVVYGFCPANIAPGTPTCTAGGPGFETWMCSKCVKSAASPWTAMGMALHSMPCGTKPSPHPCAQIENGTHCTQRPCRHCDIVQSTRVTTSGQYTSVRRARHFHKLLIESGLSKPLEAGYIPVGKSDLVEPFRGTIEVEHIGVVSFRKTGAGPLNRRASLIKMSLRVEGEEEIVTRIGWEVESRIESKNEARLSDAEGELRVLNFDNIEYDVLTVRD